MSSLHNKGVRPMYIGIAAAFVFFVGVMHQARDRSPNAETYWPFKGSEGAARGSQSSSGSVVPDATAPRDELTFYEVALKHGTDKVTDHSYHDMYDKYLPALRHKRVKMLEIGLGCNMGYGPGASYYTWLEYFTNVDLYFIEYDAKCAETWAPKATGATIVPGDQGDAAFLQRFMSEHGKDFDIIVDDGGHTMSQQQTSLEHLWKAVKPGGMYFCEDLQTSYFDEYGGGNKAIKEGKQTTMQYIHKLIEDMTYGPRRVQFEQVERMFHVDCSREICAFFKREHQR